MMLFCVQREGAAPARSIDAAIIKEPAYGCYCRLANGIYRNSPHHISQGTVGIRPDHRDFLMRGERAYGKSTF